MRQRSLAAVVVLSVIVTPMLVSAQDAGGVAMRTVDGHPDISGMFTFRTLTPFERPAQFEGLETLGVEEAAAFEASERTRQNRDLFDPERGARTAGYAPRSEGGVLSYNEFWYERGVELTSDKRTSLIVDPPDGRRPPRTAAGQADLARRRAHTEVHRYDSYENRTMSDRCLGTSLAGPPMRSGAYNNNAMIFQTADYVVIQNEMANQSRIIPLDDRVRPPFAQLKGLSRGRWEGETLVIETTNFRADSSVTGQNLHLVERLTRFDADTVTYEYTVTDPTVFTAPYTVMMPLRRTDGPIFEYACHEGNIGMYGILAGARNLDRLGRELRP